MFFDDAFETIEPESTGEKPKNSDVFETSQLNDLLNRSDYGANVGFRQISSEQKKYVKQKYNIDLVASDFNEYDKLLDESYKPPVNALSLARTGSDSTSVDFESNRQAVIKENQLLEELKQNDTNVRSYHDIQKHLQGLASDVENEAANLSARSEGITSFLAELGGSASGALNPSVNPINFATLPFGGAGTTAFKRIGSAALTGAAVETLRQITTVQDNRDALNLKPLTLGDQAFEVLSASAGEAAFQGVAEGIKYGGGKIKGLIGDYRSKLNPTDDQTLDIFASLESGGVKNPDAAVNPKSGATGRYQITPDTWQRLIKKFPEYGYSMEDIKSPAAQKEMTKVLLDDNNKIVSNGVGKPLDIGEKYITHFAGASQATKLIKNRYSDEPASIAFTPEAIKDNPNIFYEGGDISKPMRSASQVYDLLSNKAKNKWVEMGGTTERRVTTKTKRVLSDFKSKMNRNNPVHRETLRKLETQILFEEDINPHSPLTPQGRAHIKQLNDTEKMLQRDPTEPLPVLPAKPINPKEWFTASRAATERTKAIKRYEVEANDIVNNLKSFKKAAPKPQRISAFIKSNGGIIDTESELAARGINAKNFIGGYRKAAANSNSQSNLLKNVDSQAISVDGNAGVLQAAIDAGYFPKAQGVEYADYASMDKNMPTADDLYDLLARDIAGEPVYSQSGIDAMRNFEAESAAINPYGEYFTINKGDTPQTIADKIYEANKTRDIEGIDYKINELESELRNAYSNTGLSPDSASKQIGVVRALFETYLSRYGDAGLRNAITSELDKLRVEYKSAFSPNDARILNQQSTQLNKTGDDFEEVVRGSISFDKDSTVISISQNADASTFIHEMGHFAFRMQERLASHPDAPAELKADYETMRKSVGATDDQRLSIEQEEELARMFEGYLRSGIAPNPELKGLFQTLSDWLMQVYQKFTELGVKLSDDVIDVFDRMLTDNVDAEYKDFQYLYEPILPNDPLPSYVADISPSAIERAQEGDDSDAYYDALFEDFKNMEEAKDFTIDIDGEKYDYERILNELDEGETIKKIMSECKI